MASQETLIDVTYVYNGLRGNAKNLNQPIVDLSENITILNDNKAPKESPEFTTYLEFPKTTSINGEDLFKIKYMSNITSDLKESIDFLAPKKSPTFTGVVNGSFLGYLDGNATLGKTASKISSEKSINRIFFDGTTNIDVEELASESNTLDISEITEINNVDFGNSVNVIGSGELTSLGFGKTGIVRTLIFQSNNIIIKNNLNIILPGDENISCKIGDIGIFVSESETSGIWKLLTYVPKELSNSEYFYLNGLKTNIQDQIENINKLAINDNLQDLTAFNSNLSFKKNLSDFNNSINLKKNKDSFDLIIPTKFNVSLLNSLVDTKANVYSPTFSGTPRVYEKIYPKEYNTDAIATTEFVNDFLDLTLDKNLTVTSGFSYSTSGFSNIVGSLNTNSNYFYVYPPTGKFMGNLVGFLPSIAYIHFNGGVNSDDILTCNYEILEDRIKVNVQNSEQRSTPAANWIAFWDNAKFTDPIQYDWTPENAVATTGGCIWGGPNSVTYDFSNYLPAHHKVIGSEFKITMKPLACTSWANFSELILKCKYGTAGTINTGVLGSKSNYMDLTYDGRNTLTISSRYIGKKSDYKWAGCYLSQLYYYPKKV